ncbi:MAG: hypothetical protein K2Z25_15370 [Beijerinckiaceae bacterium]|nr:hypothetical protein [Beijerinckiaceae bacterium]
MNISEFAAEIGVNEGVVRRGIKRGRIIVSDDGSIDPTTQVERWKLTRDGSKVRSGGRGRPATASTPEASHSALATAALRDKKLEAEIELLHQRISVLAAETVDRRDMTRAIAAFSRTIRDKLIGVADRHGLQLAAACGGEPKSLMGALEATLRQTLAEIAQMRPAAPAQDASAWEARP